MLQTFKTKFLEKKQLTSDIFSFRFQCEEPNEINFSSGQYLILHVPQADGTFKRKLYSISSSSQWSKNAFDLLAKILPHGIGSDYLKILKVGDEVIFEGPAGVFILKDNQRPKIFLATGTGIAPVKSIILSCLKNYADIPFMLFWGLKTMQDVYYFDELKELSEEYSNFSFKIFLSRDENLNQNNHFAVGRVNAGVDQLKKENNGSMTNFDFYICGDRNIVESIRQYLISQEVPTENISFEKFV